MTTNKQETWRQALAQARQSLLALLNSLEPAQWDATVFSENSAWTVATVVGHLIDGERGMSIQVHKIRKGEPTIPEGFDLERWNAGVQKRIGNPSPAELLAALESTRAKTLEGLASLKEEEWALSGRHPSRGIITIEQYYATMAGHDQQHKQDIEQALGLN
ncbi:MAG: DinB family protein [Chloroflexi bacterium]|nr:DinB family protein [Chloroflexota bacterium]